MGRAKQQQLEEMEQGWEFLPWDARVCERCVAGTEPVAEFVREEGSPGRCSYCSMHRRTTIPANGLMEFIFDGVTTEYGQADEVGLPVAEGSYIFEPTDGDDLLFWELGFEVANPRLWEDIRSATCGSQWCKRNPLAPAPHQQTIYSWQRFAKIVKHHVRFLFARHAPPAEWADELDAPIPPGDILEHVADLLSEVPAFFRTLRVGESVYRARWSAAREGYTQGRDLAAPPPGSVITSNRMSPAGISVFYGALDEATALIETVGRSATDRASRAYGTVARWELIRPIWVLDLTADVALPSIFDPAKRDQRTGIRFLDAFRDEVSAPVKNGSAGYEYVPTQILTEYVRLALRTPSGERVAGMVYPSAQRAPGANVVLFVGPEGCGFQGKPTSRELLVRLNRRSIRRGIRATSVLRRSRKPRRINA